MKEISKNKSRKQLPNPLLITDMDTYIHSRMAPMNNSDAFSEEDFLFICRRIRELILYTTHHAGGGHTGGSLSEADLLVMLFFKHLRIDPHNSKNPDRDRFILSKGHATPGYYAALAYRGFFPLNKLSTFDQTGSILQAHPDMHKVPGVEISTGSLGQGLSCGIGMAEASEKLNQNWYTYVLIGDGESTEGQLWEAILYAGSRNKRVKRLIALVDSNKVQLASKTEDAVDLGDLARKYRSFGWEAVECDGHSLQEIDSALSAARRKAEQGPVVIINHTIKGKGVSFMEMNYRWHGKAPNDEEYINAIHEIQKHE